MKKAFWNTSQPALVLCTSYILKIITKVKVIRIIAYLKLNISVKNGLEIKQNN